MFLQIWHLFGIWWDKIKKAHFVIESCELPVSFSSAILFVSMVSMFFLINNSLRPLSDFTRVASDLADGKMDEKIVWDTQDEIGKLADVLERLRVSLKAAMERLSR